MPLRRAGIGLWAGSPLSPSAQALGCPWGRRAGEARRLAPISCREGREQGEALPRSARVHAPIVPANNGGDEQALEPMTQTQVREAAGWLLKESTVCAAVTAPALPALPG